MDYNASAEKQKIIILNKRREKLESKLVVNLARALEQEGISAFRFDFPGNWESEGSFRYGNYSSEVEDLRAVVEYFTGICVGLFFVGGVHYRVTEESMMERLNTNMHEACLSVDPKCRVLTVHGSDDEDISVEDAEL
ncbi:hypothetical protein MIMGU_mgv1a020778mg, partial [Erythranthe guttata]